MKFKNQQQFFSVEYRYQYRYHYRWNVHIWQLVDAVCCLSGGSNTSRMQQRRTGWRMMVVVTSRLDISLLVVLHWTRACHQLTSLRPLLRLFC